jgi:hypothetical protein
MKNATIFTRAFERDSKEYNDFKKEMGDRFIDIKEFPDGVPIAWQDKKLHNTGKNEPICDMIQAKFGLKNINSDVDLIPLMKSKYGFTLENTQPPSNSLWDEEISEKFNNQSK